MCGYLHYFHLPVSFDQSGPSPLTYLINKVFPLAELLLTGCFSHLCKLLQTFVHENPKRSAVSEIFKPPCLASTINPQSKSLLFHILIFGLKNSWTSWLCLHAFMYFVAVTCLADYIFAVTSWCTGLPNKVNECIIHAVYTDIHTTQWALYYVFFYPYIFRLNGLLLLLPIHLEVWHIVCSEMLFCIPPL